MRLLTYDGQGELVLTGDLSEDEIPPYAILSHTWGRDQDEVTLQELNGGPDKTKAGYKKLQLCGAQAKQDKLGHFWVDTCCIDKTSSSELSKNINLMFRYYHESTKCYVYLSDVSDGNSRQEFKGSRWFKRGWTLQELLAPGSVEFFSNTWEWLGSRATLEREIHEITSIPLDALHHTDLSRFSQDERMRWTTGRATKEREDKAYCLMGIFGVSMAPRYGEGEHAALTRLRNKIRKNLKSTSKVIDDRIREFYLSNGCLDIERLSGQRLPMDVCFINLSIVDASCHGDGSRSIADQNAGPFHLAAHVGAKAAKQSGTVTLETLFEPQKLTRGIMNRPKRIVVWGRAGMGKTTLCRKVIYDFLHNDLWQGLFDRIFWLPLRRLKLIGNNAKSVAQMVQEICFHGSSDDSLSADVLEDNLETSSERCLFVLDGLDEISYGIDHDSPMGANLYKLLRQDNVMITSRPHSTNILRRVQPDLEFETIGFLPEQVEEFLHSELKQGLATPHTVSTIRSFIRSHPTVRGLARIPIQLDAICYVWDQDNLLQGEVTMTLLYQAITRRLWQRDIVRLHKKFNDEYVTSQQIRDCANIKHFVHTEMSCLEELAFAGLYDQSVEFTADNINAVAGSQEPLLDSRLSKVSFLRSSESLAKPTSQTHHFIHLTFQEFFAAQFFIRHWLDNKEMTFPEMKSVNARNAKKFCTITPIDFLRKEKYNSRYDIFWRFVCGLVQAELGNEPLDRLLKDFEAEPRDQLGPVHQMLVIHCLNEIVSISDQDRSCMRIGQLEGGFQKWTCAEVNLWNRGLDSLDGSWLQYARLLVASECPSSVFEYWLGGSDDEQVHVMTALVRNPIVSSGVLKAVIANAQNTRNISVRNHALAVIAQHCDRLSEEDFSNLFASRRPDEWLTACELIPMSFRAVGRLLLQNVIKELARNNDPEVLHSVTKILIGQPELPGSMIATLLQSLQNPHLWNDTRLMVLEFLAK